MSRGKHARSPQTGRIARNATTGGIATLGLIMASGGTAAAAPDEVWAPLIECESGGNPTAQNPTSTASGLYQIIDGTWQGFGGLEFAPTAAQATPEQQRIVAERILAGQGPGAWEACDDSLEAWIAAGSPGDATPPVQAEAAITPSGGVDPALDPRAGSELVVEEGDTLVEIGEVFGIPWRDIAAANGITEPWTIHVGQLLIIPGVTQQDIIDRTGQGAPPTTPPADPPTQPITHVVQQGEWLSTIAQDYGVCTPEDDITTCWEPLYEMNRDVIGPNPDRIFPGQELWIVGGVPTPIAAPQPLPVASSDLSPVQVGGVAHPAPDATLTSGYGPRGSEFHDGIDLAAPLGTPIYSATDGIVISAGPAQGFGQWIRVQQDDGTVHVYGHMFADDIFVQVGDLVVAGQHIANIGNNGDTTGPHLHYRIHLPGDLPTNPVQWLADRGLVL